MAQVENREFAVISRDNELCSKCGTRIYPGKPYMLREKRVSCGKCNNLLELVLVPSGDAALTRRISKLCSVAVPVCEWNRRRKRWERRGTLATAEALAEAEAACVMDLEKREQARAKARVREAAKDKVYIENFAIQARQLYPSLPDGAELIIAQHACEKYSGRVGRTAAAKTLDEEMITLAVVAHIRHLYTEYDDLLMQGVKKEDARQQIRPVMQQVLNKWRLPLTSAHTGAET